jgi:hypothetical protein
MNYIYLLRITYTSILLADIYQWKFVNVGTNLFYFIIILYYFHHHGSISFVINYK